MNFIKTDFEGVFLFENKLMNDNRGTFQKLFQKSCFDENGLKISIDEHFFSVSHKGVIRGMHFQQQPHAQAKLVYVMQGKVIDVIVDLRKKSPTFKEKLAVELSSENRQALFIPEGFAHGFQSLEDNTLMVYLQSQEYKPESDSGINPLSIGLKWPIEEMVVSDKDKGFSSLKEYRSPF